jgi:hypothetical protein
MSAFINNTNKKAQEEETPINMSEICENESELAYVNRMKCKYGDERWMWAVEYTEDDCYLADMHREWLYNRGGAYPTFDIYENHGYPLDDDEEYEEDEEYLKDQEEDTVATASPEEKTETEEEKSVFFMRAFYG